MPKSSSDTQNQILGEASSDRFQYHRPPSAHPICIENLGISRNHAFIIGDIEEKVFILEDLQSLNGTYVNRSASQMHAQYQ